MSTRQYAGLIIADNCLTATVVLARRPQKFHPEHEPGCGSLCQLPNVPTERIYSAMGQNLNPSRQPFLPTDAKRQPTMHTLPFVGISCASMLPYEEGRVRSVLF